MKFSNKAFLVTIAIGISLIACNYFSTATTKPLPPLSGNWKLDSVLADTSLESSTLQLLLFAIALNDNNTIYMQFKEDGTAYFKTGNEPDTLRYQQVNDSILLLLDKDTTRFRYTFAGNDTLLLTAKDASAIGFKLVRR
ncbi:MAG: hypothetical protein ACK4HE_03025 [Chitinophagaceae bacterium]